MFTIAVLQMRIYVDVGLSAVRNDFNYQTGLIEQSPAMVCCDSDRHTHTLSISRHSAVVVFIDLNWVR